jgi:uncharacterized protein (DUF4213/DUF364 family)
MRRLAVETTRRILETLLDGPVADVRVGLHWTAVVVQVDGELRCGLASTLSQPHEHGGKPAMPQAGDLGAYTGRQLAEFVLAGGPEESSVGVAAVNALLPREPHTWREGNAEDLLARLGRRKRTALVGHFPFVSRLREVLGHLDVIERAPREGDLPEAAASEVLPKAEVVAITGMAFVNRSLDDLLGLCSPEATVIVLGPSTPMSRVLLESSVHLASGSIVTAIEPVLRAVSQGGNFRQVHHAGVRLVTIARPDFDWVFDG